ncbi:MAG: hypothetical protein RL427_1436 [Bacteroidota bacterium]|jgi:RHS repeat-associated protein
MKKILFCIALFPLFVLGQSPDQNYIKTTTFQDASLSGVPPIIQVTYFDGLGRPIEKIAHKQSPQGNDLVIPIEYDEFGRQLFDFLPIVSGQTLAYHGITKENVISNYESQTIPSVESTSHPFSQKLVESSPLNRVLKQASPGNPWSMDSGHEIMFDYQTNIFDDDKVLILRVSTTPPSTTAAYEPTLIHNGSFYQTGTLYKTITRDENWSATQTYSKLNTTEEFKNKEGQLILKRNYNLVENHDKVHDTYYVYDDFGNLTYVIPPLAAAGSSDFTAVLDDLCYQYKYDFRNRLIEKKLPGKQWEYIVYNNQDKPIATGPVLNPWGSDAWGWMITKYDVFGRVVYTGWKAATINSESRNSLQESLGSIWYEKVAASNTIDDVEVSYTNDTNPKEFKLLTVNYYDTYEHAFAPLTVPTAVEGADVSNKLKGLATGSWVRVLTKEEESMADVAHLYYDYKGSVVKSEKRNYLGGYTITENKLGFTGKVLQTTVRHKLDQSPISSVVKVKDFYTYSDQGRLLVHTQQINSLPIQLIAKNDYDELGQLITKQVGGTDVTNYVGLQKVDYSYNIRGWLKGINNIDQLQEASLSIPKDLFAFKINYNDPQSDADGQVSGLFNGNIAETFWRSSADNVMRKYGYAFDNLNRLRKAIYQKPSSAFQITDMYNEEMDYDLNGNIQWMKRNGDLDDPYATFALEIDNLHYDYDEQMKNRLKKVTDYSFHPKGFKDDAESLQNQNPDPNATPDYEYDENGNMRSDANKAIASISYNHLNLPVEISFNSTNKIEYLYDGTGVKVQKKVTKGAVETITNYMDGFQYTNSLLSFFPHAEGYVNVTRCEGCADKYKSLYDYVFNYMDQVGNVRLSWALDKTPNQLKIVEENHYYPFGLKHTHYNVDHKHFEVLAPNEGITAPGEMPFTRMAQLNSNSNSATTYATNKFKFQGQERQDELGLNWDSFKYRNYDYAIGRFMNIDPLTEEYNTWSPYAFSGNRVIDARELEGLEPYTIHFTKVDAAKNFGEYYNGASILENREYASGIFSQTITGKMPLGMITLTIYSYNQASRGAMAESTVNSIIPSGSTLVGDIHSHGASTANDEDVYLDNDFSDTDIIAAINLADTVPGYSIYLTTPNGSLLELDVENPGEIIRSTQMPSDPKDPERLNAIDPVNNLEPGREQLLNDIDKAIENGKPIN